MSDLVKECIVNQNGCRGDDGETDIMFMGRFARVPKGSDELELFGALDSAYAYTVAASVKAGVARLRRALRKVAYSLLILQAYVATGADCLIRRSEEELLNAARIVASLPKKKAVGWVMCSSEICSEIDKARVEVRRAEREAARLGLSRVVKALNHASNILFEAMRATEHVVIPNLGASCRE